MSFVNDNNNNNNFIMSVACHELKPDDVSGIEID